MWICGGLSAVTGNGSGVQSLLLSRLVVFAFAHCPLCKSWVLCKSASSSSSSGSQSKSTMLSTPKLRQQHHHDDHHHHLELARHYYRCQHCVLKRFYLCNDMFQVSSSSCFPNRISHANLHVGVFRMDPESRAVKANAEWEGGRTRASSAAWICGGYCRCCCRGCFRQASTAFNY